MDSPEVPANAPTTKGTPQPLPATLKPAEIGENRAKVYLRLTLSPPGKRTPLIWPGPLPTRAPEPLKP
jgi:type VI secretion system protein ImpL